MFSINIIRIKDAISKNGIHVNAYIIKFLVLKQSKNLIQLNAGWQKELVYKRKNTCLYFYGKEQRFVHLIN